MVTSSHPFVQRCHQWSCSCGLRCKAASAASASCSGNFSQRIASRWCPGWKLRGCGHRYRQRACIHFHAWDKQTLKMLRRHRDIPQACSQILRKHWSNLGKARDSCHRSSPISAAETCSYQNHGITAQPHVWPVWMEALKKLAAGTDAKISVGTQTTRRYQKPPKQQERHFQISFENDGICKNARLKYRR